MIPAKQLAGGGGSSAPAPTSSPTLSNGAYTTTAADTAKVLAVTTGSSNAVITLVSAATAGDGAVQQITKADTGTGIVQVFDNSGQTYNAASAWLITQGDVVFIRSNGTAWTVYRFKIAPWRQVLTASGSVVVPPLFTSLDAQMFSGGGGGGSGQRAATTVSRAGGQNGSAGTAAVRRFNVVDVLYLYTFGTSIPCTIGAGGLGAAAATADNTARVAGASGGVTSLGMLGDTSSLGVLGVSTYLAGAGGNFVNPPANSTTAIAGLNGSPPGDLSAGGFSQTQAGYGTGGTTSGTLPTAGTLATARLQVGGGGGGGGAYISGQAGQAGANGGPFGGGGGSGAPSDNGFASGAGGNGGAGGMRLTWNFGE